jgi:hypothetical protein
MTIEQINNVCAERYSAGILAVNPTVALWLVSHIFDTTGLNVFHTVSRHRNKYGAGTDFPEFGTKLFSTL